MFAAVRLMETIVPEQMQPLIGLSLLFSDCQSVDENLVVRHVLQLRAS